MHVYARGRKEALRPKRKLHLEQGSCVDVGDWTLSRRVKGNSAGKGERMLRKQERETVWANAGGGAWGALNSCAYTLERKNKSDEQLSFLPTLVRILTEIKSLSSLFRDFFTLWGDMRVYTYRGCRYPPSPKPNSRRKPIQYIHRYVSKHMEQNDSPHIGKQTAILLRAKFATSTIISSGIRRKSVQHSMGNEQEQENTKVRPNKCFGTP